MIKHRLNRQQGLCDAHQIGVAQGGLAIDEGLNAFTIACYVLLGFIGIDQTERAFNAAQNADD